VRPQFSICFEPWLVCGTNGVHLYHIKCGHVLKEVSRNVANAIEFCFEPIPLLLSTITLRLGRSLFLVQRTALRVLRILAVFPSCVPHPIVFLCLCSCAMDSHRSDHGHSGRGRPCGPSHHQGGHRHHGTRRSPPDRHGGPLPPPPPPPGVIDNRILSRNVNGTSEYHKKSHQ